MHYPRISILVPVYGVAPFVEKCARSLFEQSYQNIEYIFVNDCTPDNSMEIIEQTLTHYPDRIAAYRRIDHPKNVGIASARNTLLAHATGDYFIFTDSDDWVDLQMVEKFVENIQQNNPDIAICQYYKVFTDHKELFVESFSTDKMQRLRDIISLKQSAYLMKIMIHRKFQYLFHFPPINVGEDYIFCVKLFSVIETLSVVDLPLYYYVQYNNNSYSKLSLQNIEDRLAAIAEVERHSHEKGFYNDVVNEINERKFIIKKDFLLHPVYKDYQRWADTYPESNTSWRHLHFRIDYRLIFWLAEKHCFWLIDKILTCKRMLKKFKSTG